MDPITHGVIGLAISSFSGQAVSLDNPAAIGCALGAMAPDIDVVSRLFFDDLVYCKHHRGFTHSVPALAVLAVGITYGLTFLFPTLSFWHVFLWTFIGGLSHTGFDILNSYGAMLIHKKLKVNILSLYDPVISILAIFLIAYRQHSAISLTTTAAIFFGYIFLRFFARLHAGRVVKDHFGQSHRVKSVRILPSLKVFYKWDFIVDSVSHHIVGNYNPLIKDFHVISDFVKDSDMAQPLFHKTNVGRYFADFTPNYHIEHTSHEHGHSLRVIDLRYHFKGEFMHHASVELDHDLNITESYFQPYSQTRKIPVHEGMTS